MPTPEIVPWYYLDRGELSATWLLAAEDDGGPGWRPGMAVTRSAGVLWLRLNRPQSFVPKYETGERRIDVVEFVEIARAVGFDRMTFLPDFLFDGRTDDSGARQPKAGSGATVAGRSGDAATIVPTCATWRPTTR